MAVGKKITELTTTEPVDMITIAQAYKVHEKTERIGELGKA